MKKFTLEYRYDERDSWGIVAEAYTREEAVCIYENHNKRYIGWWRILEEHVLG